ncbi:MAG TPA: hypothetical protein VF556_06070 [Pyrinomonadaceae bacterium]|jgi:hypothetical protein
MNFSAKIILIISFVKMFFVSLLLIGAIALWVSGVDNILLPGLGLVISLPFVVVFLLASEIILLATVILLRRYIAKTSLQ